MREYRRALERLKGMAYQLYNDKARLEQETTALEQSARHHEKAQIIIQEVARTTQQGLEYHINELVSLAMAAVFENPYTLEIEFVLRRDRTEADLWFVRDGKRINPMTESGGGAVDVASFGLRVAAWCLACKRTRNTLLLDEPLKWLKGRDLPERGALMIKEISAKLNLQIIYISHIPEQIEGSDKVIEIVLDRKGVSKCVT